MCVWRSSPGSLFINMCDGEGCVHPALAVLGDPPCWRFMVRAVLTGSRPH